MKRTLLEVFCGLAALVVMVSFHHQIGRLEQRNQDVDALRDQIQAVAATHKKDPGQELQQFQDRMQGQFEGRLTDLETRLRSAAAGTAVTADLKNEIAKAETEVANFRRDITSDFARTKALVDAYIDEVRTKEKDAASRIGRAREDIATLAGQLYRNPGELTRAMLAPTVQLNGEDTVGSGTLVFSGKNPKTDKNESWVLTSHHVVRNILADTPKAQTDGFEVTIYLPEGKVNVKGRMTASNPKIDAALVQLQTERVFPSVANVLPRGEAMHVQVWDPVCTVGCPLGNDPVPSHGEVSSLSNDLNGANYWMINAPAYFGNSGGGVYRADTRQLIGVFSKIYTHGKGNPVVVPHMGLCTPITAVYEWLAEEKLEHLLQGRPVPQADLGSLAAPVK